MIMHRTRTILSALTLSLALTSVVGCKSEVDEKPKAKVEKAEEPPAKPPAEGGDAAASATAKTYTLSTADSSVGFIGAKVTADHEGSFSKFDGTATVEDGKITGVEITVDMTSVSTDDEKLTGHLQSPDFFNVEQHPTSKFTLLSVTEKAGEGGATHEVAGNLEMVGKTNKVTFPATMEVSDGGVHGNAEFSINRKDWDITYAGMADDLIKDDVALKFDVTFK